MIARGKVIDQVLGKCAYIGTMSAATTAQETGEGVDRLGVENMQAVFQAASADGNDATPLNLFIYDSDTVSGTYTIYNSAVATTNINVTSVYTTSTVDIDLSGAKRWVKAYVNVTAATTVTALVTATFIFGDYAQEPAS